MIYLNFVKARIALSRNAVRYLSSCSTRNSSPLSFNKFVFSRQPCFLTITRNFSLHETAYSPANAHTFTNTDTLDSGTLKEGTINGVIFDEKISGGSYVSGNEETLVAAADGVTKLESFSDYGLGGWSYPQNWLQNLLEFIHTDLDIAWIPTIAITTILLRLIAIPAFIRMRSFVVRTQNYYPEQMKLQMKAMTATNEFEKKANASKYMNFMREKNINPIKPLLFQLPIGLIYLSFFGALREMSQAKLPSLTESGMLWFTDLTVADPYFLLPVLACMSMSFILRYGAASGEIGSTAEIPALQKVLPWIPFISLPFFVYQPSSLFIFWLTSNVYSFVQLKLFLNPRLQRTLGIPELVEHPADVKAEIKAFKENMFNMRRHAMNQAKKAKSDDYQAAQQKIQELQEKLKKQQQEHLKKEREKRASQRK